MSDTTRIIEVQPDRPDLIGLARELFAEYQAWLGDVVCSHRLAEEIAALPGPYSPPQGRLMLAFGGEVSLGCIGIRPHGGVSCEMKRLYVRPSARGQGVGPLLVETAIVAARSMGYSEVLLSTVPGPMDIARRIYEEKGFEVTQPFRDFSHVADGADLVHMRLVIAPATER